MSTGTRQYRLTNILINLLTYLLTSSAYAEYLQKDYSMTTSSPSESFQCNVPQNVVLNHSERISNVEIILKTHSQSLQILTLAVDGLNKQFTQVKWAVIGGLSFYVSHQVGFVDFLAKVLG